MILIMTFVMCSVQFISQKILEVSIHIQQVIINQVWLTFLLINQKLNSLNEVQWVWGVWGLGGVGGVQAWLVKHSSRWAGTMWQGGPWAEWYPRVHCKSLPAVLLLHRGGSPLNHRLWSDDGKNDCFHNLARLSVIWTHAPHTHPPFLFLV